MSLVSSVGTRESLSLLLRDRMMMDEKPSRGVIVLNERELLGDYVKKGVAYSRQDNKITCCKFCHIVATCSDEVLYEEDLISVFRPLHPANESHVLIVPKQHVRNINFLTTADIALLERMKEVAMFILSQMGYHTLFGRSEIHLSFHRPPFNSIDHVHMHAMVQDVQGGKLSRINFVGAVKYSTGTWWCKSYDQVHSRLVKQQRGRRGQSRCRPTRSHSDVCDRQRRFASH
ncbi:unnamed protein product [Aphanomyces euteiches]|uniref:HIT domain-containing protein n=1 Tax=Aphanomyces euteiches TaxID=100861 RepID=A0A6G0X931_9STRA|nr:hypothetical protein Ae201684_007498 [Aphanomyces euteiches]KAH9100885.1 hypothetical protein Ae201684P_007076 [Aphanomyces euteiches]